MLHCINQGPRSGPGSVQPSPTRLPVITPEEVSMDSFPAAALPFAPIAVLLEAHCKNAAAVTSANQVLIDGLTALAQQQGALLKTTVDDCSRATGDVLAGGSLEDRTTRQAEAARQVCVSTFDRLR